jgi:hypothetical protein
MPKKTITAFIDLFYPPFKRLMPVQTFRYAACGGGNTLLGLAIFGIFFEFVFKRQVVDIRFYVLESYSAALFVSSCVNFIIGFLLMKYVVFVDSNLKGRIQLFRYLISFSFNFCLNYFLLKLFVDVLHWRPFLSQCFTTAIVITISYVSQKHFTFKVKQDAA